MPVIFLIIACALWGLSFPLVKALHLEQTSRLPGASSLFLASWMQTARFGVGAMILLPFILGRKAPTPGEWRQGLVIAFWGGMGMWIQADGLSHASASTSAFLTQGYCIFLPLWASIRLRTMPGSKVIVATLMVLAGGAILSGVSPGHLQLGRGELETLAAAVLFTFQILALENRRYRGNRGVPVSFIMFLGIAVLFVPISVLAAPDLKSCYEAGASVATAVIVCSLALFCSAGAYVIMNVWQPHVPATEAGLIYTIEPVFTAIFVLFLPAMLSELIGSSYPNESLSVQLIAGGALILAANILMQWKRPPHLPPVGPVSSLEVE
jgi:drug/metabolite transporter (DMT)-like permease